MTLGMPGRSATYIEYLKWVYNVDVERSGFRRIASFERDEGTGLWEARIEWTEA